MGFSPLADMRRRVGPAGRQSRRNSRIRGFTIHHQAGVNAHGQATAAGREVSANYWITNDGVIIPNVDENMRAWTTGAPGYPAGALSDHRNVTVEVSNSPEGVRTGSWAISAAARAALVALIGDVFKRHRLGKVRRGKHGGVAVHQDFVATACPGPYVMKHLGSIIRDAERARKGGKPSVKKGLTVIHYQRSDKHSKIGNGRTLNAGEHLYLNEKDGRASRATNIGHGVGPYSITPHVYAEGQPGDGLDLTLIWQDTKSNPKRNSPHYVERLVFDKNGKINASREFKRAVANGYAVYARLRAPSTNQGTCRVTRFDSDAYLIK